MATPSRPFWWRFPAPSTLVGAAILFNLPWLEVQCNGPAGNKMVVGRQTGLQTALGSTTDGEGLPPEQQAAKGSLGGSLTVTKTEKQAPPKAPLMIAFGIVLCGGILFGLGLPLTGARRWLAGLCAAGALAILAVQAAIGFPAAQAVDKFTKEMQSTPGGLGNPVAGIGADGAGAMGNPFAGAGAEGALGNPFAGGAMGNPFAAGAGQVMSMKVAYTPWYYLTWGCLAASLLLLIVEAAIARSAARSPVAVAASGPAMAT